MPRQKRILIVRPDRVGDVVMITPMIRELRRTWPDAFIATLTQPHTSAILLNNPHLDVSLVDDMEKTSFWDVVKNIRSYKFTHALLVMPTERAAWQLFLAGIVNRVGVGRKLYEILTFMRSVSRHNYIPLRHEADFCMDLARKIGVRTDNIQPEIFVSETEKNRAEALLLENDISLTDKRILFHTGSRGSAPNWKEDKYLELLEKIFRGANTENTVFLLTAVEMSPDFIASAKKIGGKHIVDVSKQLPSLRDLIGLISIGDLMLCSSTGPIHLADALDIPCVGLHCNRAMNCAKHWGVINKKSVNLEVTDESCKHHCSADQNSCGIQDALPVDVVSTALNTFLLNKKSAI